MLAKLDEEPDTKLASRPTIIRLNGVLCKDLKSSMEVIYYHLNLQDELADLIGDGTNFEGFESILNSALCKL